MERLSVPPPSDVPAWTAIVLAGGQSRRMGHDKAVITLGDEPLLRRVVRGLLAITNEVVVVGRVERSAATLAGLPATMVADRWPGRGPLAGLASALSVVTRSVAVVVGCDMPALTPALLHLLAKTCLDAEVAVPRITGRIAPLPLAFQTRIGPAIERLLAGPDDPPLQALARIAQTRLIEETVVRSVDPDLRSFLNINTPADLARAVELMTSERHGSGRSADRSTISGGW
jgi:molybdopterin-guanine dinucleotide biosynthesis protein A